MSKPAHEVIFDAINSMFHNPADSFTAANAVAEALVEADYLAAVTD